MAITQAILKERFNYDAETGIFTWKIIPPHTKVKIGDEAGVIDATGYRRLSFGHKPYLAHRLAWLYVYGYMPNNFIDHVNRNRADNRILNLRECTYTQNQANRGLSVKNTSGVKGVHWDSARKKWVAAIRINGVKKRLGGFDCKLVAAEVYRKKSVEVHGDFATSN